MSQQTTATYPRLRLPALLAAAAMTLAGLTAVSGPASADVGLPVSLANAGSIVDWGVANPYPGSDGLHDTPASLNDRAVTAIASSNSFGLALTADGHVTAWGAPATIGGSGDVPAPAGLDQVTAIAAGASNSLALKSDGTVIAWGDASTGINDVPAGLSGVTAIAAGANDALALKSNGTVVEWGSFTSGDNAVPAGLSGVTAIAIGSAGTYGYVPKMALKSDGTVVEWGARTTSGDQGQFDVPATIQGHVTKIAAGPMVAGAITDTGKVVLWGGVRFYGYGMPPALDNETASDLHLDTYASVLTASGNVYVWGDQAPAYDTAMTAIPPAVQGHATAIATGGERMLAIVPTLAIGTDSGISGTPQVGANLTGTPATFSDNPDTVETQWLADGTPIAGVTGTTLSVDKSLAGKKIAFRTRATKGSDQLHSDSATTAAISVASTTKVTVSPAASTWGKAHTITATVTAGSVKTTGKVTIKAGSFTKTVALNASGVATATVPANLKVGRYAVSASYAGSTAVKASTGAATLTITKATVKLAEKFPATIKKNKRAKAAVTAKIKGSSLNATGTVKIYKGKKLIGKAKLKNGKATIKLAKLPRGKQKLTIKLPGNHNTKAATKKFTIRVK